MASIIHPILASVSTQVVAAGRETMPVNWSLGPRMLEVHDLIYIRDGGGEVIVGPNSYKLMPGQWFILPAGVTHRIEHQGAVPLRLWVLHFTVQAEWDRSFAKYLDLIEANLLSGGEEVRFLMNLTIESYQSGGKIQSVLANRTLDLMLSYLLKDSSSLAVKDSRITKALKIVHEEYNTKLTLDSLSKRVGLSPFHFRELFSEFVGISPSTFIRNFRIQRAREMLQSTDYTIQEIANKVGWENASTFIRTFTQQNGVTPGKFRDLNTYSIVYPQKSLFFDRKIWRC